MKENGFRINKFSVSIEVESVPVTDVARVQFPDGESDVESSSFRFPFLALGEAQLFWTPDH